MEKKKILSLAIVLFILAIIGGLAYSVYMAMEDKDELDNDTDIVVDEIIYENLKLQYNYKGDNLWEYTVTGTLPNPCYLITTEAIVMESYPEQVIIKSYITTPDPDLMCVQVIQDVFEEGEFEASEEAVVTFEVE